MKNGSALQWLGFRERTQRQNAARGRTGRGEAYGPLWRRTNLVGYAGKGQIMRT